MVGAYQCTYIHIHIISMYHHNDSTSYINKFGIWVQIYHLSLANIIMTAVIALVIFSAEHHKLIYSDI